MNADGSHLGNSDAGLTKKVATGTYEVTFNRVGGGAQVAKTILSRKCGAPRVIVGDAARHFPFDAAVLVL